MTSVHFNQEFICYEYISFPYMYMLFMFVYKNNLVIELKRSSKV